MFIENAYQGKRGALGYVAGTFLIILVALLGGFLVAMIVSALGKFQYVSQTTDPSDIFAGVDPNLGLLLNLVPFITGFAAIVFVITQIHQRSLLSLITPNKQLNWGKILFSAGLWFFLTLSSEVITYFFDSSNYQFQFEWQQFILLVLISLLILPIQTSFEELFLRGYLMQSIGLIVKFRWVSMLITAIIFGLLHGSNPEIDRFGFGLMMTYYISFGLVAAYITLLDDSLEIALGLHAANNIFGATMVTFEGSALMTPALFKVNELDAQLMLVVWVAMILVYIFILGKKYNWTDWGKPFQRIKSEVLSKEEELENVLQAD